VEYLGEGETIGMDNSQPKRRYRIINLSELPLKYKRDGNPIVALITKDVKAGIAKIRGVEIYES